MRPGLTPRISTLGLLALGVLVFTPAHAQPPIEPGNVQLRWDACYADGGSDFKTFACNTNSGSEVLVVTATPGVDLPQLNGMQADLHVHLIDATLPS